MPRYIDRMFHALVVAYVAGAVGGFMGVLLDTPFVLVSGTIALLLALVLCALLMLVLGRRAARRSR